MNSNDQWDIYTQLLHGEFAIDRNTGAPSIPIYQTSTFHQPSQETPPEFTYSRWKNPTRFALEQSLALLEKGSAAFAFSSGIAAITSALFMFSTGDHIVACKDIYGGTSTFLTKIFPKFGIETTFVDTTNLDEIKNAIKPNTKCVYLETPSNPTLKITDIQSAVELAHRYNLIVMVDNTFMSPYLQQPLTLGADIVIHSGTKFLGGHSDVLSGFIVVNNDELASKISFLQMNLGGVLGAYDSWLMMRGIKTLKMRMETCQRSAITLAEFFANHEHVKNVYFPGLKSHQGYEIQQKQANGPGCVLSIDLETLEAAEKFISKIQIPIYAVSLGGVETIVSYPIKMSHASMSKEELKAMGVGPGLIRISIGSEEISDLISDFTQALA